MSRILRRPMFRGGRVSSYGTGIAAPLVPGYQGGGQIGGGIIYGKPMADGRYGFDNPILPEFKIGAEVVEDAPNIFKYPAIKDYIPNSNEIAENEAGKINEVEPVGEEKELPKSSYEKMMENNQWGNQDITKTDEVTIDDKIEAYKKEGNTLEDIIEFTKKQNTYVDEKGITRSKTTGKPVVRDKSDIDLGETPDTPEVNPEMQKLLDRIAFLEGQQSTVEPEVDAKTAVAENKELFRDLLGYDKARGQDISEMLLGFAGAEGDDTWSKTKSFFKDEAKRPGRAQKISDAAGTLAIQDYIAGKRSKEKIEEFKKGKDYESGLKMQLSIPQKTDTFEEAKFKLTVGGISPTSPKGLKFLIGIKDDTPMADNVVSVSGIKIAELTDPGKTNKIIKKLKPGYNILDDDGVKRIILYDGSGTAAGIDVMTVSEFWSKK